MEPSYGPYILPTIQMYCFKNGTTLSSELLPRPIKPNLPLGTFRRIPGMGGGGRTATSVFFPFCPPGLPAPGGAAAAEVDGPPAAPDPEVPWDSE